MTVLPNNRLAHEIQDNRDIGEIPAGKEQPKCPGDTFYHRGHGWRTWIPTRRNTGNAAFSTLAGSSPCFPIGGRSASRTDYCSWKGELFISNCICFHGMQKWITQTHNCSKLRTYP